MTDYNALAEEIEEAETNNNNGGGNDTELPEEAENAPLLNVTPQCALAFDEIVDVGMAGGVTDEQNIRVSNGYSNDLVVTLKNPSVDDGELFAATNGAPADYKLVDTDNPKVEEDVKRVDGEFEVTGIQVYGNSFESERVDDFEEEYVKLFIGSSCGQRLAMLLDCRGGESAYYADGEKTSGLVEYPPKYGSDDYTPSDDGYPRLARTPTLRSDMVGESGVLFFYLDEDSGVNGNAMHKVTAFKGEPDVENALAPPTADDELGEPEYPPYIVWDEPNSGDDGGDDGDELNFGALSADEDEGGEITDYDDLGEEHQMFVDKAKDSIPADADIEGIYTAFCDDNGLEPAPIELIETEIRG